MTDLTMSKACADRLATNQSLVGAYHRDCLSRIGLAIADLREAVQQMTPREARHMAADDLIPLYEYFCALQDEALRR